MKKETDLNAVKLVAKQFLYMNVIPEKYGLVAHPIIGSRVVMIDNVMYDIFDILEDLEICNKYMKDWEKIIDDSNSLMQVFYLIRKPYRLVFIKYIMNNISRKDFSELLSIAWTQSENPNQDINCSVLLVSRWFKKSDKKYLMNDEDYKVYNNLPDKFVIYRGVSINGNPYGLSWTRSFDKAKFFSQRFSKKGGYIASCVVLKQDVLAYFNTVKEDEIVVDYMALKKADIKIIKNECEKK